MISLTMHASCRREWGGCEGGTLGMHAHPPCAVWQYTRQTRQPGHAAVAACAALAHQGTQHRSLTNVHTDCIGHYVPAGQGSLKRLLTSRMLRAGNPGLPLPCMRMDAATQGPCLGTDE